MKELEFIDKEWYIETMKKKGMVDKEGGHVWSHPDFQSTPVRITRSRALKIPRQEPAGGYPCNHCHKKFKTIKTLESHIGRYHECKKSLSFQQ